MDLPVSGVTRRSSIFTCPIFSLTSSATSTLLRTLLRAYLANYFRNSVRPAPRPGFEPRISESESEVLPLHQRGIKPSLLFLVERPREAPSSRLRCRNLCALGFFSNIVKRLTGLVILPCASAIYGLRAAYQTRTGSFSLED